ncbi:DUF4252 domain-containing protein [Flavobacterium sp. ASW18X]|uniref:DUF4252 domain-containing protein n=1 Tax=Flavobacterium sp. ASW18X TaxID=2572595 RepID=UPI0010AEE668|nr:DUF4252 domain-containing protein [Flavobacterium sp. ASW18X]TKD60705.1 DUF4252 domain-containing protein [Flavobacterium sp. ASW18X]
MKKVLATLCLAILPIFAIAQSVFDKYENSKDVATVSIGKGLLKLASHIDIETEDPEVKDFLNLAKNIDEIKVYVTEKSSVAADLSQAVKVHLKERRLESLMKVKDKDAIINFYVKSTNNDEIVKELLMHVEHKDSHRTESVVVNITGKIELEKIGALVNQLNLPEEVKEVKRSK